MTASPTVDSVIEAVRDTHLVILTDWEEFRSLDLGRVGSFMRTPIVVDGRNLFEPTQMQAAGFEYYSLGRGEATFRTAETGARALPILRDRDARAKFPSPGVGSHRGHRAASQRAHD